MQLVVNCETRLCSQFLGSGDHFFLIYFFAKLWCDFYGSGSDRIGQSEKFDEYFVPMTAVCIMKFIVHDLTKFFL